MNQRKVIMNSICIASVTLLIQIGLNIPMTLAQEVTYTAIPVLTEPPAPEPPISVPTEPPVPVSTRLLTTVPAEPPILVPTESPTSVPTEPPAPVPTQPPTPVPTQRQTPLPTVAPIPMQTDPIIAVPTSVTVTAAIVPIVHVPTVPTATVPNDSAINLSTKPIVPIALDTTAPEAVSAASFSNKPGLLAHNSLTNASISACPNCAGNVTPIVLKVCPKASYLDEPLMLIPYEDDFQISIYLKTDSITGKNTYYYSPALLLLPSATTVLANNNTDRVVVQLAILMWDSAYHEYITKIISERIPGVPPSSIRLLPINDIRIEIIEQIQGCRMAVRWMSYISHSSTIRPQFVCDTPADAVTIITLMQNYPEQFCGLIEIVHSMTNQIRFQKQVQISGDQIRSGHFFSLLRQSFPNSVKIYMQNTDAQELLKEIAQGVTELQLEEDQFVSYYQARNMIKGLSKLFNFRPVTSGAIGDWNSVYWQDVTTRPDVQASKLNMIIDSVGARLREILRREVATPAANFSSEVSDTDTADYRSARSQIRQLQVDSLAWTSNGFVPRSTTLMAVDMSILSADNVTKTTTFWATRSLANVTAQINFVRDQELKASLNAIQAPTDVLIPVGTIVAYHNKDYLPEAWLWCNGMAFDAKEYPRLAGVLNATMTPNLTGRFLVGVAANRNLGTTGGEEQHTLIVNEMPSHAHTVDAWTVSRTDLNNGIQALVKGAGPVPTSLAGGDGAHNNMPPFMATGFIIKAG